MQLTWLTMLAICDWISWILSAAFFTLASRPVIVIISLSEPLSGRSIFVSVSSRIFLMLAPPLPMTNLWNCLKMGSLIW